MPIFPNDDDAQETKRPPRVDLEKYQLSLFADLP
jgi:hypothetical protein